MVGGKFDNGMAVFVPPRRIVAEKCCKLQKNGGLQWLLVTDDGDGNVDDDVRIQGFQGRYSDDGVKFDRQV